MKVAYRTLNADRDWPWVRKHIPCILCIDTSGIVAYNADTGEILAAGIADSWTMTSAAISLVITDPVVIRHNFLQVCFGHMFIEKKVKCLYAFVAANNVKAIRLNTHLGFVVKTELEDGYAEGVNFLIMAMTKDQCKHLPKQVAEAA